MDGVIIDSTPMHNRAWEVYLERCGRDSTQVQKRMHGLRNDDIVRDFFGKDLREDEIREHGAAKERLYREMMAPVLERNLIPGVRGMLEELHPAPMAVASNAEPANIDFVLDGAGIRDKFLTVVDGHFVERPKPDPEIYLKAAEFIGVKPENCVIFEDSIPGVRAAVASGARVVALTTTLPRFEGAHVHVKDFLDPHLTEWLRSQRPH
jgi:HAD superfamily hydrolase (TIGR01509 family)